METVTFAALLLSAMAIILAGTGQAALIPMTKEMKQTLLDTHNELRARTARGQTGSQPSSGDMMLLEWDDRLMEKAATWVTQCQIGHDQSAARAIPDHSWVGQNWAGGHSANMSLIVRLWYGEYKDYIYAERKCAAGEVCGHYTQVVWAKSLLVGCAAASCSIYPVTLVCNYADGGNFGTQAPYESGPPASKCIGEFTYTKGSLCLRKEQCAASGGGGGGGGGGSVPGGDDVPGGGGTVPPGGGDDGWGDWDWDTTQSKVGAAAAVAASGTADTCRCAIACLNGGTMDAANCKCACTANFYGTRCELACADPEAWRPSCESDTDACKNYPSFCPKTCKQCSTGDIRDKNAVNVDAIISRVP